jgi:hypothetical protein
MMRMVLQKLAAGRHFIGGEKQGGIQFCLY